MIDLRSDTCSLPTPEMREVMLRAPVGDDVYHDDPSVCALEERVAALLGKEEAMFTVTGTMANQVALRTHTESGDQILMEADGHVFGSEGGAPAALSGLSVHQIAGSRGVLSAEQIEGAFNPAHRFNPDTLDLPIRLVCLENTHNEAGGVVWPLDALESATGAARAGGAAVHLDGARLWNACVEGQVEPADYARHCDSVSVCFSKGLGAPMGSALVGSRTFIRRARRFKQLFGGGFRQGGIMAAGALYALEHHRQRLAEDHANAAVFADGLLELGGVVLDREAVQTNIVRFALSDVSSADFVDRCHADGVHMLPTGRTGVRAIFYLGVTREDTERALEVVASALAA